MKSLDSKTSNQDWHPNVWPPFTQINNSKPQIEVTHGRDALLFTKNPEKELIDAISMPFSIKQKNLSKLYLLISYIHRQKNWQKDLVN